MNWLKSSLLFGCINVIILLATACGETAVVPPTPTMIPTPVVQATPQVIPSVTPIPSKPTTLPTLTATTAATAPMATATRALTATPSPKDMVLAAFTKSLANLKTYRVEIPQESRYIAVQLPDRFLQEGADSVLKIGGTVWRPDLRGKGWRIGGGSTPYFDHANLYWYQDQFAKASQVTLLGPGTAEGVACIGYSMNLTYTKALPPQTPGKAPEVTQGLFTVKIWFATGDGFPRRIDYSNPMTLTVNFFDLNQPFTIAPPQ